MKQNISPAMFASLRHMAAGNSLAGFGTNGTFRALIRRGLIEDTWTLTDKGKLAFCEDDLQQAKRELSKENQ